MLRHRVRMPIHLELRPSPINTAVGHELTDCVTHASSSLYWHLLLSVDFGFSSRIDGPELGGEAQNPLITQGRM